MSEERSLEETPFYGGQAVLEGVMMRAPRHMAVAVRKPDGDIVVHKEELVTFAMRHKWARWPFLRGTFALVEALVLGIRSLNFSAEVAAAAELEAAGQAEQAQGEAAEERALSPWALAATMAAALGLGIGLFVLAPTYAADLLLRGGVLEQSEAGTTGLARWVSPAVLKNLVEGVLRLLVIVGYIASVSFLGHIRRVFEYHGAEHKVIHAYEAGRDLEAEGVGAAAGYSAAHPRCGTAFLLLVIVIKVIVSLFLGWPTWWLRAISRVAMLPLIAGIAYELTRAAGKHKDSRFWRALMAPGLWLQALTTREPDEKQIEVAQAALTAVQEASGGEPRAAVAGGSQGVPVKVGPQGK
ncbi:MAG: DUF1385 domain-containing protein [Armatimonadota bacterium]